MVDGRLEVVFKRALGAVLIGLAFGKTLEFALLTIFSTPFALTLAWFTLTIVFFIIFMYWGEIIERVTESE